MSAPLDTGRKIANSVQHILGWYEVQCSRESVVASYTRSQIRSLQLAPAEKAELLVPRALLASWLRDTERDVLPLYMMPELN